MVSTEYEGSTAPGAGVPDAMVPGAVAPDATAGTLAGWLASCPDPRELVALSESLRLGRSTCVLAGEDGALVRVNASGDYLLVAQDAGAAARLVESPAMGAGWDDGTVALMNADWAPSVVSAVVARGGEGEVLRYRICVYEKDDPLPCAGTLDVRPLTPGDLPVVLEHYGNLPEEFVRRHLEDGWMYGGYDTAGELVGFIGEHDEGAIGMLEVFPEHRRRGYASELAGFAVNRMLSLGRVPFSQVVLGNEPSFAMHRKLGWTVLPGVQCWVW